MAYLHNNFYSSFYLSPVMRSLRELTISGISGVAVALFISQPLLLYSIIVIILYYSFGSLMNGSHTHHSIKDC